jgi:hypothetical protein
LRPSSEELGNRLQTPTLIGCIFLMNLVGADSTCRLVFACFAAISRASNYRRFFEVLSTSKVFSASPAVTVFTGRTCDLAFAAEP